jgi:hypothetical protein
MADLGGLQAAMAQQTAINAQIEELSMKSAIQKAWHDAIMSVIQKIA